MIEVGTKLKSVRNGDIVEVIKKAPESILVRTAEGTEKSLSASTVARWYDEVKEQQVEKKTVSQVVKKAVKKEVAPQKEAVAEPVKVEKPKKDRTKAAVKSAVELIVAARKHIEAAGWKRTPCKTYDSIYVGEKQIGHVYFQKTKVKFAFKNSDLTEADKVWMVKCPEHFKRTYCYSAEAKDISFLKRCLDLLGRIANTKEK